MGTVPLGPKPRGGKGTFRLESMRGVFQVLVLCLLALNLVGAAEEEVQEEATESVYGQILPVLNPALRDKRARKWDHSNRWGFGSDGYLYDFVKRFDSSRWGGGSDGHLYDFAKRSKNFDSSRWGSGSDGYLQDFVPSKRFDSSRWGGGSDGHLYDFAKK